MLISRKSWGRAKNQINIQFSPVNNKSMTNFEDFFFLFEEVKIIVLIIMQI